MNTDINLLVRKDEQELRRLRRIKIFRFASFALLIGIGAISLFIFLLIQIANPISIRKEQEDVLRKLSQFKNKEAKLFIFNDRVNSVTEILGKRKDLPSILDRFLAKVPKSLTIDNLEIDDRNVSLTASSTSLLPIGELINNLTDMVRRKEITSLTLNTLAFDESKNNYQFSVTAGL